MFRESDKETHVFLESGDSFTSIAKQKIKGVHQVFTTEKLTSRMADQINKLYNANLEVTRVNFEKGFMFIKLKRKSTYKHIVEAVKTVLHGQS